MAKRWFGFRDILSLGFTPPKSDSGQLILSLNTPAISNGDTILRTLFAYYAESHIEGDASGLEKRMTPGFVALTYDPDPDGLPIGSAQAPGGEMLYRDMLNWQQRLYSNGTDYGVKYWAGSTAMASSQANRIIHDKTTARLLLSASLRDPDTNFPAIPRLTPDVDVMLWVEYLVDVH